MLPFFKISVYLQNHLQCFHWFLQHTDTLTGS
nr:MAG TPA: hypothetical protein [Caudoviricetes sp.]